MELDKLTGGGTPFKTNVNVQGAAAIADGALITNSAVSTTGAGATITVTTTSGANDNCVGVTQVSTARASEAKDNVNAMNSYRFNIDTDGIPNRSTESGSDWVPTCINSDAMYFMTYATVTTPSAAAINKSITASVGTVVTVTSIGQVAGAGPGGWLMDAGPGAVSSAGGTPTFNGQVRAITASAASTILAIATAMNVSTDSMLLWAPASMQKLSVIAADGVEMASMAEGVTVGKFNQGLLVVDNYLRHDQAPTHPLRYWVDDGLDALSNNLMFSQVLITKFYSFLNA